jgi:hypothetical protein
MQESTGPRSGTDPITNTPLSPTTTMNGTGNPINDHERQIATPPDDIEYACIFDLPTPKDCSNNASSCDCNAQNALAANNPLCAANPADMMKPSLQVKAKAYPGIKHLAIAKGMQTQGIAASICPKQLMDATQPDYGYRPAVKAIIDRLKQALHGECLPRQLSPNAQGQVECLILEATNSKGACTCDPNKGRIPVDPAHQPAVDAAKADPLYATAMWDCFCEVPQVPASIGTPPVVNDCQTATSPTSNGWCYVDPSTAPLMYEMQEAALVAKCPATEQHNIRFVGNGAPNPGATLFITCAGQ